MNTELRIIGMYFVSAFLLLVSIGCFVAGWYVIDDLENYTATLDKMLGGVAILACFGMGGCFTHLNHLYWNEDNRTPTRTPLFTSTTPEDTIYE